LARGKNLRAFGLHGAHLLAFTAWFEAGPAFAEQNLSSHSSNPAATLTIIHASEVLTVPGKAPLKEQSIFIESERVVAVKSGYHIQEGATLIDLKNVFVLPGLIDLHVHLTSVPEPGGELEDVTDGPADLALIGAVHAERLLNAGFTSILDMGTGRRNHEEAVFALREVIAEELIPGPRIFAVGSPLSIPGQSRVTRFNNAVEAIVGADNVCTGADDCSRVVREQVSRGADVINVYNTGSLLSIPSIPITFSEAELQAIADAAHSLGRSVIADGGNTPGNASGVNAALRAGFDAVDTVTYADDETWKLLKAGNAYFVPHLYAVQAAVGDSPESLESGTMGWLPEPILQFLFKLKQETPSAIAAHQAGVRFAFGSDPGVFPHGLNAREFSELVRVGLTADEAIIAATSAAAEVLRRNDDLGSIEEGKFADIIAVAESPLKDVQQLEQVIFVMKGGKVHLSLNEDFPH